MTGRKLIRLEIRTNDGEKKVFDKEPAFNFDPQVNCCIVSSGNQLEVFFFSTANIIFMKANYELAEMKPIIIPTMNLPSIEVKH